MSEGTNRRDFIKYTAATGMGFWVAARKSAAEEATASKSPNEKVNFAIIGCGGKGDSDSNNCGEVGNIVAICDTNDKELARKGHQFPNAKKFNDYRKMFDEMAGQFDAHTASIADHNHAAAAMMGIKHGKGVYCQKPMTHYVAEARALREAANEHKVATQMGNQGTASNGLREGVETIQAGAIGAVKEIHVWTNRPIWPQAPTITDRPMGVDEVPKNLHWDVWIGPAPFREYNHIYQPFNWRGWWDWGTGALGDMGCHTANLPFMACKLQEVYPTSVKAESGIINFETYPSWASVTYEFPARGDMPPLKAFWYEGKREVGNGKTVKNLPPKELFHGEKPSDSGSLMVGEKGVLYSPNDYGADWKLLPEDEFRDFKKPAATLPRSEGDIDLWMKKEWVAAIKGGPPAMSNFNYSGKLSEFILLGNVAIRAGVQHPLEYDGENLKVTNWPEANQFLRREYRKGYEL
jgi:predicted dehydrogenase